MIAYLVELFDSFEGREIGKVYLVSNQRELLSILDMESNNEHLGILRVEKLPAVQSTIGVQNEIKNLRFDTNSK